MKNLLALLLTAFFIFSYTSHAGGGGGGGLGLSGVNWVTAFSGIAKGDVETSLDRVEKWDEENNIEVDSTVPTFAWIMNTTNPKNNSSPRKLTTEEMKISKSISDEYFGHINRELFDNKSDEDYD